MVFSIWGLRESENEQESYQAAEPRENVRRSCAERPACEGGRHAAAKGKALEPSKVSATRGQGTHDVVAHEGNRRLAPQHVDGPGPQCCPSGGHFAAPRGHGMALYITPVIAMHLMANPQHSHDPYWRPASV